MNRFVSLAVLLALIVLLGGTFYQVVAPFLLPLFLAAVLAIVCQPLQSYFLAKTGGRTSAAAGLTTVTVAAILVLPVVIGTFIAATNLYNLADKHLGGDWHKGLDMLWKQGLLPALERLRHLAPALLTEEKLAQLQSQFTENIQTITTQLAERTFSIASSTVGMFVSLAVAMGIFLTALYYFLADGPEILNTVKELTPLSADYQQRLVDRFSRVVRAVVTATFLAAFAQGLATALALQICGFGHFVIFLSVATIASLIPLAGAGFVWAPCAAWLALQGNWGAAIGLVVWGVAVVGLLDNVVKIYVLQNDADLHPLLAFISVIGALQVMGLWGIFIGPIVASCLFALIQIFNEELKLIARERPNSATSFANATLGPTVTTTVSTTASSSPDNATPQKAPTMKHRPKRRR